MNLNGLKDCMDSPSIKPGIKGLWILPVLNLGLKDCGSSQYYTCELMNLEGLKDCGSSQYYTCEFMNLEGLKDCGSSQYYTCEFMNLEGLKDCGSSQYFGSICIVWVLEMIIVFAGIIEPPEINFTLN